MMLDKLNPEYRFSSLVKIRPAWISRCSYRALLIDIDNTLLPRNSETVPERNIYWMRSVMLNGTALVLTSNNGGKRIERIRKQLQDHGISVPVLSWAGKPLPGACAKAVRLLPDCVLTVNEAGGLKDDNAPGCLTAPESGGAPVFGESRGTVPRDTDKGNSNGFILAVGDQLFTDVLGAHLSGLHAAWVRPLSDNDFIGTRLFRWMEGYLVRYFSRAGILPEEDKESRD